MGANTIPADREQNRVTYAGGGSTVADKDSPESTGQGIDMGPTMYDEAASWHVQPAAAEAAKLAAAKKNRYYALLYREMADRRQAEAQLCVNYGLLSSLNQAQIRFLSGAELSAVFQDLLNALLEITESSFGLIGDIVRIEGGPPSVDMLAHVIPKAFSIDGPALDDLALVVLQKASPDQPVIRSGSFPEFSANGDSVQEAVAALLDTYSFLGLSLYGGDETVGVLALGNRAAGYDTEMVDLLRPVQSACAQMILAKRSDEERTLAERALSEERASLAQRVAERTAELRAVNTELEFAVARQG